MVLRVLIAALALTGCDAAPTADPPRAPVATEGDSREPEAPLLGTETDARSRRERALAGRLREALQALPGVRRATVVVSLPPPGEFDRDPVVTPRALVVLEHTDRAPDPTRVRAMVTAVVLGLRAEDVRVELRVSPLSPYVAMARVGPFAVSRASAGPLRATLSALLLALAAVSALLLRRSLRGAR